MNRPRFDQWELLPGDAFKASFTQFAEVKNEIRGNVDNDFLCAQETEQLEEDRADVRRHGQGVSYWTDLEKVSVSCSVLSDSLRPHGLSLPGSSVHGILQTRI